MSIESTRRAAMVPRTGPSWMQRRSMTTPRCSPALSTTSRPISSLARMAAPRDAGDDVLVHPPLERVDAELVAVSGNLDGAADLGDQAHVDAVRVGGPAVGQPDGDGRDPAPEPATQSRADRPRADEYRGHQQPAGRVGVQLQ